MILGESGDLEYDPSLGARVKIAVSSAIHEQFLGEDLRAPQIRYQGFERAIFNPFLFLHDRS